MATVFILGCHIAPFVNIPFISQFLNVGVQIFLMISGYLCAMKEIDSGLKWIYNRYIRIFIPIIIFVLFLAIYSNCANIYNGFLPILVYVFGIQGIGFLEGYYVPPRYLGTDHLWFITVLFICYLLVLLISKLKVKFTEKNSLMFLGIFFVVSLLTPFVKIYTSYFIIFFAGYFFCKFYEKRFSLKAYIITSILMVAIIILRLLSKRYFDGLILYNDIIAPLCQNVLGFWFFVSVKTLYKYKEKAIDTLAKNKVIKHLDALSYYIYITHYMFYVGPFILTSLVGNLYIAAILGLIGSFISAEILMLICNPIVKKLRVK